MRSPIRPIRYQWPAPGCAAAGGSAQNAAAPDQRAPGAAIPELAGNRLIDRFVRHPQLRVARVVGYQPPADLLGVPLSNGADLVPDLAVDRRADRRGQADRLPSVSGVAAHAPVSSPLVDPAQENWIVGPAR